MRCAHRSRTVYSSSDSCSNCWWQPSVWRLWTSMRSRRRTSSRIRSTRNSLSLNCSSHRPLSMTFLISNKSKKVHSLLCHACLTRMRLSGLSQRCLSNSPRLRASDWLPKQWETCQFQMETYVISETTISCFWFLGAVNFLIFHKRRWHFLIWWVMRDGSNKCLSTLWRMLSSSHTQARFRSQWPMTVRVVCLSGTCRTQALASRERTSRSCSLNLANCSGPQNSTTMV